MHPLALAESGWVWVGAGSRPAGLRTGRAIRGLRRDAALPVRQNTRQGREGGALPKSLVNMRKRSCAAAEELRVTDRVNDLCRPYSKVMLALGSLKVWFLTASLVNFT